MAVYINVHSRNKEQLIKKIDNLTPYNGVCIFIDITNSADIKYQKGLKEWILLLKNTFGILEVQNKLRYSIIKFIGDEIMFFITDENLYAEGGSITDSYTLIEEIYAVIDILKMLHVDELYLKCRASIHHCTDVYNITFLNGHNDFYGKDIDIAARLLSKTKENSIVISETFYQNILNDLKKTEKNPTIGCLGHISGVYIENFKGIPYPIEFRRLN